MGTILHPEIPSPATSSRDGLVLRRRLALPFDGADDTRSLTRVVMPLLRRFGFDSLSYFVTTHVSGMVTGEMLWTTLPRAWSLLYRREAHVARDPRLVPSRRHLAPFLWSASGYATDGRVRRFLDDAHRFGIASGVVISLHDSPSNWVTVTFDAAVDPVSTVRRDEIAAHQGELFLIAIGLHQSMLTHTNVHTPRRHVDRGLTFRERDCLSLAARGLTSADIGARLCVAERTVNFHFRNIKSKLGAINRPEAIARGISLGIVECDPYSER
ncbi:MAG: LuxR family transcriptional regulator [Betaproteobacteria bacterium]